MQALTDALGTEAGMILCGLSVLAAPVVLVAGLVWLIVRANRPTRRRPTR